MAKSAGLLKHFSWSDVLGAALSAGVMHMDQVTKAMNTLYPQAGTAVDYTKQLDAISQLAMYYGAANVSQQLALIAMKQQKGFDIRALFADMSQTVLDNWVGVSMHAPVPALSQAAITTPQLLMRVSLDLVETVVGNAIMGSSLDLEMFMANELGTYVGGKAANPIADYLAARQKTPVKSSQQIKQDSLSPQDAGYLMASAAGKGQGMSPDFLGPYPGSEDPYDELHYLLSVQSTDNSPAVQSSTKSQVTQKMLQQQANAARMQGIPVQGSAAHSAQEGWFERSVDAVSSFADEVGDVLKVASLMTPETRVMVKLVLCQISFSECYN